MSSFHASTLYNVEGLVAVVTGGGSGLGRTMALTLATNGASKVFIIGRREASLLETAALGPSGVIIPVTGDVASQESLQAAYTTIAAQTAHVDLLIVNSGILGPLARIPPETTDGSKPSIAEIRDALWAVPMADFSRVLEVNAVGAYYTVVAFLTLLDAANKRRPAPEKNRLAAPLAQVIVTTSIAGFSRRVSFGFAYNLSKAAANHLVKALSTSFAEYGIRVNGIAPGFFYSEMTSSSNEITQDDKKVSDGSFPPSHVPMTRAGGEEEIAGLILWMAGSSGGYLNGNITVVDGGRLSVMQSVY